MGIIYKLTCPERKSYIGQTIQSFQKRMNNHVHGKSYCRALKEAINKYGFDNFKKEIIWEGEKEIISEHPKVFLQRGNNRCKNTPAGNRTQNLTSLNWM
jgi:group I intron endonuclease